MNSHVTEEYSIRICLVGDKEVGKSTLLNTLNDIPIDTSYTPIVTEDPSWKVKLSSGKEVLVELTEMDSNKQNSGVRQLTYENIDAVVMCFAADEVSSFTNVKSFWLPEAVIYLLGKKIFFGLLQTKSDLQTEISKEEIDDMIRITECIQCFSPVTVLEKEEFKSKFRKVVKKILKYKFQEKEKRLSCPVM
eukprot:maker-scaffold_10-snap-gene-11.3-mRNA-1 protein AED:0.28 eAED:0.43 QI:0/0/0/1/1/1/2/0/190